MHGGNRRRVKFLLIPCYGSAPVVGVIRILPDEEWVVECASGRSRRCLTTVPRRDEVNRRARRERHVSVQRIVRNLLQTAACAICSLKMCVW